MDLILKPADGEDTAATEKRWAEELSQAIAAVLSRSSTPKLFNTSNWDFQLTRGFKGVSL